MEANPILDELHRIRAEILAEHGDDLTAFVARSFDASAAAGHPVARLPQRRLRRTVQNQTTDQLVPTEQSS